MQLPQLNIVNERNVVAWVPVQRIENRVEGDFTQNFVDWRNHLKKTKMKFFHLSRLFLFSNQDLIARFLACLIVMMSD